MNFKKEYQEAYSQIKAEETFKKELVDKMNSGPAIPGRKTHYAGILAAAAAVLLVVCVGYFGSGFFWEHGMQENQEFNNIAQIEPPVQDNSQIDFEEEFMAGKENEEDFPQLDVSGLSWYGNAETDAEVLERFLGLLEGDSLQSIVVSEKTDYNDAVQLDNVQTRELLSKLQGALFTDKQPEGKCLYYKMMLENGMKIQFQIFEDGYLLLEDTDGVYAILK